MKENINVNIPNKNDIVELTVEDIGSDGEGIGKYQGYTLFIKDAVVGDVIQAKVLKTKKTYGYAKVEKILVPSSHRVEPKCPIATKCGGCQVQPLAYEKQLEFKENKVKNCLERIGGLKDISIEPIIGMEEPYYYRNKAQFPVGLNKEGKVTIGFYASRTHSIIDSSHCYIQDKINIPILETIRTFLEEYKISIYNEEKHEGLVRHILTRVGFTTKEVMVCIIINGTKLPFIEQLVNQLKETLNDYPEYHLKSVCLNVNKEKTNVILGTKIIPVFGQTFITDMIGDIKYEISPLSFFQVNPIQTKKLYELALDYADLSGEEIVWDLYCGIGTISLFLAKKAKEVYGVEIVPEAIEDAKRNAEINNIKNAEFFVGAAEDVLPKKYKESNGSMRADVIVVDPPRKGCDQSLLDTVIAMEPKKVVYVSCDPATLARDLKYMTENGYEVEKVRPVDQFPHSTHVETCVLLSHKNS